MEPTAVETYILLCDRHPPRLAGGSRRSVRGLTGLLGTTLAAVLSFAGPRLSVAVHGHSSLSAVGEAAASAPHAVGRA